MSSLTVGKRKPNMAQMLLGGLGAFGIGTMRAYARMKPEELKNAPDFVKKWMGRDENGNKIKNSPTIEAPAEVKQPGVPTAAGNASDSGLNTSAPTPANTGMDGNKIDPLAMTRDAIKDPLSESVNEEATTMPVEDFGADLQSSELGYSPDYWSSIGNSFDSGMGFDPSQTSDLAAWADQPKMNTLDIPAEPIYGD